MSKKLDPATAVARQPEVQRAFKRGHQTVGVIGMTATPAGLGGTVHPQEGVTMTAKYVLASEVEAKLEEAYEAGRARESWLEHRKGDEPPMKLATLTRLLSTLTPVEAEEVTLTWRRLRDALENAKQVGFRHGRHGMDCDLEGIVEGLRIDTRASKIRKGGG